MLKSTSLLPFAFIGSSIAQSSLSELISSQSDLSILGQVLGQVPNLAQALSSASDVTILAPVNSAFERILNSTQGRNLSSEVISSLLAYHVINGTYLSANVTEVPTFFPTYLNDSFTVMGEAVANVTPGQNVGLVRSDDSVIVLSGELQTSRVVQADIQGAGFTVHKIDSVLTIPASLADTGTAAGLTAVVGALEATDLTNTVESLQNITVFAPNNEAFQQAASAFANASQETLQSVLQYHVVAGSVVFSSQITNTSVATVQGSNVNLTVIDGTVFVNSAKVVIPNVLISNGVLHVIDGVLNPNGQTNPDTLDPSSTPSPAFSGASSATDVPFTSAAPSATSTVSVPGVLTSAPAVPTGGSGDQPTAAGSLVTPFAGLQIGALLAAAYLVL